jgi:hypothetical protein
MVYTSVSHGPPRNQTDVETEEEMKLQAVQDNERLASDLAELAKDLDAIDVALDKKYNLTAIDRRERTKAKHHRYNTSDKGAARNRRYESRRIRIRMAGGLIDTSYRVDPDKKFQLLDQLAEFNASQARDTEIFRDNLERERKMLFD